MNATLQCLIHISELSLYFLTEYPKDKSFLKSKNISCETKGELSGAYYDLINNIDKFSHNYAKNNISLFLERFHKTIGTFNPQFSKNEANDSKDLIIYLLQSFHEELNYFGDKKAPSNLLLPDSTLRIDTYQYFYSNYNSLNFSKISQLFYGTYENIITCLECKNIFYSFQKFQIISFSTYKYRKSTFNIMDGFKDNESKEKLEGNNQYFCNRCNKLVNAETINKILEAPNKLILNIDYGKNKKNNVNKLDFEHEIDIKDYLSQYFGQKTKYRLCSVCTHIGSSGQMGHYIAYCLDKSNGIWYKFNDLNCKKVDDLNELKSCSPYLLIYELIYF